MGECVTCARGRIGPRRSSLTAAGLLGLLALLAAGPAGALGFRTVAVSGDVAPGTGGALYLDFGPVVLNHNGDAAFTATLQQGGAVDASNDLGMWSEGSGALALVERQGSPAAGVSGTWDTALAPPVLNDAGQVAFRAFTSSPTEVGVWHEGSGSLAPAAVSGSQADGVPAGQDWAGPFPSGPAFNDAGQVAFQAGLAGTGVTSSNDRGIWAGGPTGALSLAARTGDLAPGAGGASWTGFEGALIEGGGGVGFKGTLDDGGSGLWAGPASGVSLVARDGSAAPGTGGGVFSGFVAPDLNDLGQLAFDAGLEIGVGGVTAANNRGVWVGGPGSLSLVAREGDTAPDSGGRSFGSFSGVLTNDVGDVAFRSFLDTGTGLYMEEGGSLVKVAASGDVAPGTDLTLGDASFGSFSDWALNDLTELAFEATLSGALQGVTGDNDETLWLRDRNGNLELVVREGDLFEYAPGEFGIIDVIDFFGESDALGRGLNDQGWLSFGLTFTNGTSGVFTAVPEPGSAALLALGLAGLAARRRREGGRA